MELVVLAQPAKATEPSEGTFDDPATRQELEALDVVGALHDFHLDRAEVAAQLANPLDELTGVRPVRPEMTKSKERVGESAEEELRAVTILNVSRMHHDGEYETERVDEQVSLASTDFLARIV